jgi:hypothetical protein
MTSHPAPLVQQLAHEFHHLLASVTGPDARCQTASTVELALFRRLVALGAARLRRVWVTRATVRPAAPVTAPDGTRLTDHDQRPMPDEAVCGTGRFGRQAGTAPGPEGLCPLDADRS